MSAKKLCRTVTSGKGREKDIEQRQNVEDFIENEAKKTIFREKCLYILCIYAITSKI